MADIRNRLTNEQLNQLRNEMAGTVKASRANTGVNGARTTSVARNVRTNSLQVERPRSISTGSKDDYGRLKTFLSQYGATRKLYQEYQIVNSNAAKALQLNEKSNGNFADNFFTILGGFAIGLILALPMAFIAQSTLVGLVTPFAGVYLALFLKKRGHNKAVNKYQEQLEARSKAFAEKMKPVYEKTNKAVAFQYASPFIVEKLIEYFECGRCDTLKEALNLYEQEKAQYEQLKLLNQINVQTSNTAAATSYLAFDTLVKNFFN